jgi:putative ABC transport system substrate-binding protein
MNRRNILSLLGGAAVWPVSARAQQKAMPVIGWLSSAAPDESPATGSLAAFLRGLSEAGYVEGRNIAIEYRWAENHYDRLPALAADLVRRRVAVIATNGGSPSPLAAKAATTTIPIVFAMGGDPIKYGLVASLNRPDGNITGVSILNTELGAKRLQLLHELVPTKSIAVLVNPTDPGTEPQLQDLQGAARALGLQVQVLHASAEPDLETIFATLAQRQAGALMIAADPFLSGHGSQLAALAARHAIPAIALYRDFTAAGGLASYGPSLTDAYHNSGTYVARILKGDRPIDLPVIQSVKFELIVNAKTAKALGIALPLSLLASADEVIE